MTETALFYGTKRIQAQPMTRAKYNEYRGWDVPKIAADWEILP